MSWLVALFLTIAACILLRREFKVQLKKAEDLLADMRSRRAKPAPVVAPVSPISSSSPTSGLPD